MENSVYKILGNIPGTNELQETSDIYYDETWQKNGGKIMSNNHRDDLWFPSGATDDFFKAGALWQKALSSSLSKEKLISFSDEYSYEVWKKLADDINKNPKRYITPNEISEIITDAITKFCGNILSD